MSWKYTFAIHEIGKVSDQQLEKSVDEIWETARSNRDPVSASAIVLGELNKRSGQRVYNETKKLTWIAIGIAGLSLLTSAVQLCIALKSH